MTDKKSKRSQEIQPFHVMALLARAHELEAQGKDIVHMEIGEPDFPTPQPIIDAGLKAIETGNIHYTPAVGLPELRQAISNFYKATYGVDVSADRIVVTPGASGALLLVLGALLDPGQEILMADPGYPCNRNFVRFLEGQSKSIPVTADTDYQLTPELVKQNWTEQTKAVLLASPSNPTGTLVSKESLKAISTFVDEKGGYAIVDEIYHGLVYDQQAQTVLGISNNVFVINSFSKYFGMTGWRIGWLVAPESFIPELDKLAQNLFLAAPTTAQHAALAAFTSETQTILEARRDEFKQRRDFLLPALRELGFDIPVTPQGAFYLYANCKKFTDDSFAFSRQLLEEAGVAVTPGLDFGSNKPEQHLRFAYTTSLGRLEEGVKRIKQFINK
jgi:aspartate/methionine/tyrosine aminotransferase